MTTARQIITTALRKIAANSANAVPTAEDMDIGLQTLNSLIDSKSTTLLNIHTITPYRFQFIPGQYNYLLGPTGDWVTERPMRLEKAKLIMNPIIIDEPVPVPPPPDLYTYYGYFVVRNGYDGDVGIPGYITESNPFYSPFSMGPGVPQTYPDVDNSFYYLSTAHGETEISRLTAGGGDDADTPGTVGPMAIDGNRQYTNVGNGYFNRYFYVPMRETDEIWVVGTYFAGYGDVFSVDVVVGPSPTEGEWYNCYGNSVYDYDATIILERLAWAGDR